MIVFTLSLTTSSLVVADLYIGAGLDVDLSKRLTIRAEGEQYEFSGALNDSLWASLLIRF